jgi:protein tyrosine phosphatase (PTP) superfamily phosphohydrolase (DUF442 family)
LRRISTRIIQWNVIRTSFRILLSGFLVIVFVAARADSAWCETALGPDLPNFGQVTQNLYRGAQPSAGGFARLRTMGVGLVINFRQELSETALEKRQVESLGMSYIGIPWSAHDDPSNAQVAEFLDAIRAHPDTKIFVHCRHGADRTGVMVAAYRIAIEHEKVPDAISEMHRFHFDSFWHPQLARYVKSLPDLLQSERAFKSLAAVVTPIVPQASSTKAGTEGK